MNNMEERKLNDKSSCFLIKDERLKKDWGTTPIFSFLKEEGFVVAAGATDIEGIDWLYVNIYSKVYRKGKGGVALAPIVGEHAITFEEFLTIYNIFKKYEGFSVLKMNEQEQAEFEAQFPFYKMQKIIGCTELTHEVLNNYLRTGWWNREMLPWEHCGMDFHKIYCKIGRESLTSGIHLCYYEDKPYYFGLGLKEPEVTDDMLENGTWLVYTWSD